MFSPVRSDDICHLTNEHDRDSAVEFWFQVPMNALKDGYLHTHTHTHTHTHIPQQSKSLEQWWGFPGGLVVKNLPANAGDARDVGLIINPWW